MDRPERLFDQISMHLEPDQRLVFPDFYSKHPWIYDKVDGVVYLIVDTSKPQPVFDWIWENALIKVMSPEIHILARLISARVRDPNSEILDGWLISEEEYQKDKKAWDVLDVYVVARRKDFPHRLENISVDVYQAMLSIYEPIGIRYLVRTALPGER